MLAATSFRVLTPLPVVMVAEAPALVVIVNDDAGRAAVGLAARSENHDPVVATFCTTTEGLPVTVPLAAVAVTALVLEDVTVRADREPVTVFREAMSVVRAVVAA